MTNRTVEEAADRNEPKWDCPTCGVTHVGARAQAAINRATPSAAVVEAAKAVSVADEACNIRDSHAAYESLKIALAALDSTGPAENGIMPLAWEVVNAYRGVTDSGGDGRLNKALDALHEAMDDEPPAATDRLADAYAREIEEHESRGEKAVDGKWVTPPAARPEGGA